MREQVDRSQVNLCVITEQGLVVALGSRLNIKRKLFINRSENPEESFSIQSAAANGAARCSVALSALCGSIFISALIRG